MARIHCIRLREPWNCHRTGTLLRWTRRFGRPGGLAPSDRLWLVVTNVQQSGRILLNGNLLGTLAGDGRECRFAIARQLDYRNELVVELLAAGDRWPGQLQRSRPGDVALEIEAAEAGSVEQEPENR